MGQTIQEVMTADPRTVDAEAKVTEAAALMRDHDIGAVIVTSGEEVHGIVTDRDIAIRAVAEGRDPGSVVVGDIATRSVTTLAPSDDVEEAIDLMRQKDVRRVPVVDDGKPVGVVSLGDLAQERDPESVLADISSAPPDS